MRVISAALCLWAAMASGGQAATYLCSVAADASMGGYISDIYAIDVDEKNNKIIVDDAVIEYFEHGPQEAFGAKISDTKITFNWDVMSINDSGQTAKLSYRGVLFLRDLQLQVSMKPIGYSNSFHAVGRCRAK